MPLSPKALSVSERPSRWRLTYAWELQLPREAIVVNLPINPTTYEVTERAAQRLTRTVGGVHAEEAGFLERDIVVEGTCGLAVKRGWSPGSPADVDAGGIFVRGGMTYADGNTLWRELRNLFRIYGEIKELHPAENVRLIWHDFRADDHWVVIPTTWEMRRTASDARLHYPYRVEMTAVADADVSPFAGGIFRLLDDAIAGALGAINQIIGYIEDARAFVDGATGLVRGAFVGAIAAATRVVDAARSFKQAIQDFINLPAEIAAAARGLVDAWRDLVGDEIEAADAAGTGWSPTNAEAGARLAMYDLAQRMSGAFDALLANRQVFRPSWRGLAEEREVLTAGERLLSRAEVDAATTAHASEHTALTSRATPGSFVRRRETAPYEPPPAQSYAGFSAYTVRQGDTIWGIATRAGVPDAWPDIAAANRLQAPYITPLRPPGTVWVGDVILVPASVPDPAIRRAAGEVDDDLLDELLGVDFYLDDEGEWELDGSLTDLRLVRGVDCYAQGLSRIAFRTRLGTNLVFPEVGIRAPIGEANGAGVPAAIAVSVRAAAKADPRTAEVSDVQVVDGGDTVGVEVWAVPKGYRDGRVPLRRSVE